MIITLTLAPELESRLKQEASRRGLPADQCALNVLEESIVSDSPITETAKEKADKLAELFRQWNEEEVDESEALDDDFFRNLRENRVTFREITLPEENGEKLNGTQDYPA